MTKSQKGFTFKEDCQLCHGIGLRQTGELAQAVIIFRTANNNILYAVHDTFMESVRKGDLEILVGDRFYEEFPCPGCLGISKKENHK